MPAGTAGSTARSAPHRCPFRQTPALRGSRHNVFTPSSTPNCLEKYKPVVGFTAQLLSQQQMSEKLKGNMSRGSIASCFHVLLVARKNISLVSLWAPQVSIGGALLAARENKTANVREKIGRSKALRMCPVINVPSRRQKRDIRSFSPCWVKPWELLPQALPPRCIIFSSRFV